MRRAVYYLSPALILSIAWEGLVRFPGLGTLATPLGPGAVARADLVLAPGLAADRTGTRMGQGGGCYDRALARCEGTPTVVLLHPGELVGDDDPPLPREHHDRAVDAVLIAEGLVDLGLSRWRSPRGAG